MVEASDQPQKPTKVSVLVVSHNRAALLRRCLESLEQSDGRETIEILVVDNGSTDGSDQLESEFAKVRFIRLPRNFGLTKALNIGIRGAAGEYIFFLHEDTEVFAGTVSELAAVLDAEPAAAAACPLLITRDGSPAPQLGDFPAPGKNQPQWRTPEPGAGPIPVEYPRGAALMVRGFLLKAMRQIDERYGVYGSDAEVCYQIRRAGKKILLLPSIRAMHHVEASSSRPVTRALVSADRRLGIAAYLAKHFGFAAGLSSRVSAMLAGAAALLRFRDIRYNFAHLKFVLTGQKIDGTQRE